MTTSRKKPAPDGAIKTRIQKIIGTLERAHPDAKLDLDFTTPLELLIALFLAAPARDDLVNKATGDIFKDHRRAADYAATPLPVLQQRIGKINFYRNKAKAIHNCCKELVERFGGKVPDTLDDLISLPGVGRKTANIVLGNAFGQQAIGVDTHVMRLSQRLGFTAKTDADKIEADLMQVVPQKQRVRFCHLLQYHGRRVCTAKKPKCSECAIRQWCLYPDKNL